MTPNLLQSPNQSQFQPNPLSRGTLNTSGPNYLDSFKLSGPSQTNSLGGLSSSVNTTSQTSTPQNNFSAVSPSQTGGISFNPVAAQGFNAGPVTPPAKTQSLSDLIPRTGTSANGGSVSMNGAGVQNYSAPSYFNIDSGSAIPSSAINGQVGMGDIAQKHAGYMDYVNALVQAEGYSPSYLQAYQGQQQAGLNQSVVQNLPLINNGIPSLENYMNNPNAFKGDTLQQTQALQGQEAAQANIAAARAGIDMSTQQLARQGNISQSQAALQYSPAGMAGQNAINQYNTLQQQYPGANIPEYNTALTPEENQQIAQYIVSRSPAYRAGFQSTYQTPGGGTGIYSKLDVGSGAFSQNQDGTYTLVPAAAAALGAANANVVNSSLSNLSTINAAINASSKTLQTTTQFMNQFGLNQTNVPIITQIENNIKDQTTQRGAIAGLNADLNTLRSDYSQFLIARGGSIAGTGPNSPEVMQAIPDNISPQQLQILVQQMQQDGQNTADAVAQQVNQSLQGIRTNSVPQGNTQTQGGSLWSF